MAVSNTNANQSSVTNSFSPNTKARSSEVNTNFNELVADLNGGGVDPAFGTIFLNHSAKSADYTVLDNDGIHTVLVTTGGTDRTITLPTVADNDGRIIRIKKVDSGTGKVTVDGEGSETVDDSTTIDLDGQYSAIIVQSDASKWHVLSRFTLPDSEVIVHTGNGHGSTATKIRRFSTEAVNIGSAITYADSASDGATFTINKDGVYAISYDDESTNNAQFGFSVNVSSTTTNIVSLTYDNGKRAGLNLVGGDRTNLSRTIRLSSGDVVRAHTNGTPDNTGDTVIFSIALLALT